MSTTESKINVADQIQQYKCPNCTASVEFDSTSQQMRCPYCDSEFDIAALQEYTDAQNTVEKEPIWDYYGEDSGNGDWSEGELNEIKGYVCQSCGGEIITDDATVATKCPYCDNPVVLPAQVDGIYRPDLVIPFKLTKKDAVSALDSFLSTKKLLPNCFTDDNHIDEVSGVYVPFWLFDCKAAGKVNYRATRISAWSDARYNYTKTNYYMLVRDGEVDFAMVPTDGSEKMDDTLMESIEPYDYKQAVDFQTAYLSGYLAEKYTVTAEQNKERINERIKESVLEQLEGTIHSYATHYPERKNITIEDGTIKYALLPVWILNTTYEGKKYTFAMNGQTGKFVGDLPVDKMKCIKHFGMAMGICSILGTFLTMLF